MAIIGIDLGTTNSLICVYKNNKSQLIPNSFGGFMTSSVVHIDGDTVLVGPLAKEHLILNPQNTVASFKSAMGAEHDFVVGNKILKAHELSAFVLRKLKEDAEVYLGEPVTEAVISVPAYFNDNQRSATKLAAKLAGISVSRLINEPSAAALYYHTQTNKEDSKQLIIDFGGGTLDVSIVDCFEDIIEIVAISGDNHLGGDDIDKAIAEYFCRVNHLIYDDLPPSKRASLLRKAEFCKISFGEKTTLHLNLDKEYRLVLTKELLREICAPLFSRVKKIISRAFKDSRIQPGELSDVILVGGSSKLEVFGDFLEEIFKKRPAAVANPDEIVALGAGLYSGIKSRVIKDIVMTDVCPFSLGIATYNHINDAAPHMAVLIERSSLLPVSHSDEFYTLSNNQTEIRCRIFQGENYYADENLNIGELTIKVPPGPAGKHYVNLTFTYDIDGILHVEAKGSGGDLCRTVILNPKLTLDEKELEAKIKELEQIKLAAQENEEDQLITARLERLFVEFIREKRELVGRLLSYFENRLKTGDIIEIKKARYYIKVQIHILEAYLYNDPLNDFQLLHQDDDDHILH